CARYSSGWSGYFDYW
nr:immunoglobulin heavy chain junction region [Macaca mulatta]MPN84230.1 immunoglobulin heavy chain junction region [Macaca mulatta]MPN84361.1 immunoglobulin heavy chain junction region [Macaca mulatta]MPN84514.1 immunoglobulin heavy chain junction region [Macaca mulatta]MPN84573.1 immunoglobulin heavy chain junction region [Macaca mulatta]